MKKITRREGRVEIIVFQNGAYPSYGIAFLYSIKKLLLFVSYYIYL